MGGAGFSGQGLGVAGAGHSASRGMQVSGIMQPMSSIPPGQVFSNPQLQTAGQTAEHLKPFEPRKVLGMQVSGIGQPLGSSPVGHIISSFQLQVAGQLAGQLLPSFPTGPTLGKQVSGMGQPA